MLHHNLTTIRFAGSSNTRALERLKATGWMFAAFSRRAPETGLTIWFVVGSRDGNIIHAAAGTKAAAWARAIVLATCHRPAVARTA